MNKVLTTIVAIIFTALIIGAGGYYYLNQKFNKERLSLKEQISTSQIETRVARDNTAKAIEDAVTLTMDSYNKDNEATFLIDKIDGNFAQGSEGSGGGGSAWYAVRQEGVWKKVINTQDVVFCADANKYEFPSSMIPVCYDQNLDKAISR